MVERTSLPVPVKDILCWVKAAAASVPSYYGRFPVPHVLIRITPFEGRGVRDGMTFGDRGGRITTTVGHRTSPSRLAASWVPPPEMGHLAFSSGDGKHPLDEEGIARRVQP